MQLFSFEMKGCILFKDFITVKQSNDKRKGTRALKDYFAVAVLCHVKDRMDVIFCFTQAKGGFVTGLSDVRNRHHFSG